MITPPKFLKDALPSNRGWHDGKTGKLVVACAGLLDRIRKEKAQEHAIVKSVPEIQVEVQIPAPVEMVTIDIEVPTEDIQEQPKPKLKKRKKKEKQNEQNS